MRAMMVKVGFESEQFAFQIRGCPEQRTIQALSAEGSDQPLHKRMGQGNIGDGFDLGHLQYPQVGLPLLKPIKGIVVRAEALRHPALTSNPVVEHRAKSDTVDGTGLDAEPQDAARVLIHDDQDPVSPQRG
jgi:hypothetical protein